MISKTVSIILNFCWLNFMKTPCSTEKMIYWNAKSGTITVWAGPRNCSIIIWSQIWTPYFRKFMIKSIEFISIVNVIYKQRLSQIVSFLLRIPYSRECQPVSFWSTCRPFQIAYKGEFWPLRTLTFWQKVVFLISNAH